MRNTKGVLHKPCDFSPATDICSVEISKGVAPRSWGPGRQPFDYNVPTTGVLGAILDATPGGAGRILSNRQWSTPGFFFTGGGGDLRDPLIQIFGKPADPEMSHPHGGHEQRILSSHIRPPLYKLRQSTKLIRSLRLL